MSTDRFAAVAKVFLSTMLLCLPASPARSNDWPQAAGPNGNFAVDGEAFNTFSVSRDQGALVSISDLGPAGESWSLSSLSFADGRICARTMKELICIGQAD